eukprot:TRINITY_DN135_c0_g2_i5.p1 TRINITY_DN135_c0_g2~~TRINITY_DN135_c0_g2_i5.p1  ORF type:complete len:479 (-),score=110.58 TRINITY_DN135_c0_g2_i5:72-1508(-)
MCIRDRVSTQSTGNWNMRQTVLLFSLVLSFSLVSSHSWVACTDYRGARGITGDNYNEADCFGFARNWETFNGGGFGVDRGYNYLPGGGAPCNPAAPRTTPFEAAYSDQYPMATYVPGRQVCLAWPSKNHVAASCTNAYIPDNGVKLLISGVNPSQDPTQAEFDNNVLVDWGANPFGEIAFKGYQNCSAFCDNMDKSLCSQCFIVPNLQDGIYTVQWWWEFNEGSIYTNCFEIRVGGGTTPIGSTPTDSSGSTPTDSSGTTPTDSSGTTPTGSSGTSNPTSPPSTLPPVPLSLDAIQPSLLPIEITTSGEFVVKVTYNAAGPRVLVVDLLDTPTYAWYGKGQINVTTGENTAEMTVMIYKPPPMGTNYILKGWLVSEADFNKADPWAYQLSAFEVPVEVGTEVVYPDNNVVPGNNDSEGKGLSGGAIFGIILLVLLIVIVIALILVYQFKRDAFNSLFGPKKAVITHSDDTDYKLMSNK